MTGLALLNLAYATLGVENTASSLWIAVFDRAKNATKRVTVKASRVWLRADADFLTEKARFSYSVDGKNSCRAATNSR